MRKTRPERSKVWWQCITPRYQRRGVARSLLCEIARRAREKGCADAWLATEAHNASATALYESFALSKPCLLYYWDL